MSSTSESDSMLILHTFSSSFVISSLTSPTSSLLLLPVASPERSFWLAVSPSGDSGSSFLVKYLFRSVSVRSEIYEDLLVKRPGQLVVHLTPPPPQPTPVGPKFSDSEKCCGSENHMPPKLILVYSGSQKHF